MSYLSGSVLSTGPSSVNKPNIGAVLLDLGGQQIGINLRLKWHECFTKACRESGDWFLNALLSSCNFGSVS